MRRITKAVMATVMSTAMVTTMAACSSSDKGGSGSSDGSTELNLLVPTYSDNTKSLWEEVIAGFEKDNSDIHVNLEVQSWENINNVVTTKIQNRQAPDILNIDSFTAYASDDLLFKADDIVSKETLEKFPKNFRDNASMEGTQYALPLISSVRALFYNKELFEKAGIAAPPKTWDELKADALKIKELDGVDGYGMPLGNEEAQAETAIWVYGGGGSFVKDGKIDVTQPADVAAVSFMQDMITSGATQPDPGATQRTPLGQTFFQGKVGMLVGLPPYIKFIEERNPDLKYGVAPIPTKDGNDVTLGVADHIMAFDNDKGAKKDAIRKFLDYFYSDAVYKKFVDTENFIPVTTPVLEELKDKPSLKPFIPLVSHAKFYPFTNPKWQATQGAIQSTIGKIGQGTPAAEVLDEIQQKVDND